MAGTEITTNWLEKGLIYRARARERDDQIETVDVQWLILICTEFNLRPIVSESRFHS